MKFFKTNAPVFIFFLLVQLLGSCKKNTDTVNPVKTSSAITITLILPGSGGYGDTITIIGTNFRPNPANDTVNFNNKRATVLKATADTLIVTVPLNAGAGSVTVNGTIGTGIVFSYIPKAFVSTLAGVGMPNIPGGYVIGGYVNGADSIARFNGPIGIAIDATGNMYVNDESNNLIREISAGMVTTFAGNGIAGLQNGVVGNAEFNLLMGITIDPLNNIYVADAFNKDIRNISGGIVYTYAGTGIPGSTNGPDSIAQFAFPEGIALDTSNNLYVADGSEIRKITPAGVTTFAGDSISGYANGAAVTARFSEVTGIAVDKEGNVYVADNINYRIRKITPAGVVSTLAGSGVQGLQDGSADSAQFFMLRGLTLDVNGNVYVSDYSCIRKITPAGMVSTLAGTHTTGFADGPGATAQFYYPTGLTFDAAGNLYVADTENQRIRKITIE